MKRFMWVSAALCAIMGCSSDPSAPPTASPDAFAGTWRSVTPTLEFVRLSVSSKSSEMGVLAARLSLSGVAWEGSGRIDADSLVVSVTTGASAAPNGVIVVRAPSAQKLQLQLRPPGATPLDLTFVRDN